MKRLPLPPEMKNVPSEVIESYFGQQMAMFANGLAQRLAQHGHQVPTDLYKASAREVFQLMTSEPASVVQTDKELQLVFRHDCLALGCLMSSCQLCKHNPNRRCAVNLDKKYLVNDVLKAKCQAIIRVEVVDRATNQPVDEDLGQEYVLQMAILDGNSYDSKFEAGRDGEFDACALLVNNKGSPMLVGTAVTNDSAGYVMVPLHRSKAVLPELRVTDSSEAMLSGRKPPLRLMMRAVHKSTMEPAQHVRYAISEGFVVATRRTRTAGKADIPSVDDHVSKLEHMGKETVKKLGDVHDAARTAGISDFVLPGFPPSGVVAIDKVGGFRRLAIIAEQDTHLRQRLQQILKLSKEKWDEARDHAMKAVVVDNRMRIWWHTDLPQGNHFPRTGLVFSCSKGTVDLERPIGILPEGGEVLFSQSWTQQQQDLARQLQPMALAQWWQQNHPNWDLLEWDSEVFKADGQLVPCKLMELATTLAECEAMGAQQAEDGHMHLHGDGPQGQSGAAGASRGGGGGGGGGGGNSGVSSMDDSGRVTRGSGGGGASGGGSAGRPSAFNVAPSTSAKHVFHSVFEDEEGDAGMAPGMDGNLAGMHAAPGQNADGAGPSSRRPQAAPGARGTMGPPQSAMAGNLKTDAEDFGLEFLPSLPSMGLQPTMDMLNRSSPQADLIPGASRLMSGLDTTAADDWIQGGNGPVPHNTLHMSRNTSGLDTMQSIEQSLPEDIYHQALRR